MGIPERKTVFLRKLYDSSNLDKNKKPSTENWIPETSRLKSIQRDLGVLKANLRDTITVETSEIRETKRFDQSEHKRALVEEELGSKKKINCGCCLQYYSYVNLPIKVSYKAVIDLR